MFPKATPLLLLAALAALAGCGRRPAVAPQTSRSGAGEAEYAAPPAVAQVRFGPSGVAISGGAPAGAQVRLATPAGETISVRADAQGRWALVLPPAGQARVFGLSEQLQGRRIQAQGYLLVTPEGRAALLRAGAGAVRLEPHPAPALAAMDFDQGGAAVVSGLAAPGTLVFLRLDGRQLAEARADEAGRYAIALPQPLSRGAHRIEAAGDAFSNTAQVEISPAAPLAEGPLRSQLTRTGPRIDWLTPGGGVQSTLLFD